MKIDVAIQSYKKPESLLYALMSLKKTSEDHVDTVYINDDSGADGMALETIYTSVRVKQYFPRWNIVFRHNPYRVGWWQTIVPGFFPAYANPANVLSCAVKNLIRSGRIFTSRENLRYQWAIDHTDKKYLFIMHDDVAFKDDVLGLYLRTINAMEKPAIVGDLGQCWRCPYADPSISCSPIKIATGWRPTELWPQTSVKRDPARRACRINEWCCLISVAAAKDILDKERAFFGNYDDFGDVGAYWFALAVKNGYGFSDPLPEVTARSSYYLHGWSGRSGHSVWVDQGGGKTPYDGQAIVDSMKRDFGVAITGA